ncbi:HipA family kinase [Niallia sp. MER 6]|uniref:HipA family kinase n=1 Tax=Niallia sp. MER 6 TaxID=2939567 RepID=UPI0020417E5E|nr:HipA family kinase [Niallia sp. MER 6]MCM3033040.1 hypothetical protein [Niallia sp. MER 6]
MSVYAVEYIKDVEEGEMAAKLFLCSDGNVYIVKLMSNPNGKRSLFNELVSYRLGELLGLPIATGKIIIFSKKKLKDPKLLKRMAIEEGPHFGSLLIKNASMYSSDKLYHCNNTFTLPEIIMFDNWISNYDRREERQNILLTGNNPYQLAFIDHADAFYGPEWSIESLNYYTWNNHVIWGSTYEEFVPFIDNADPFGLALNKLYSIKDEEIAAAFGKDIPSDWQVSKEEVKMLLFHLIIKKQQMKKTIADLRSYFPIWNSSRL